MLNKSSSGYRAPERERNTTTACPDELPDFHDRDAARREWAALAPLIAHTPVIRVSRDGGKTYPHKWVRGLDAEALPTMPAAVHLHDARGCGHVLILDLDASGPVDDDYTAIATRLDALSLMWFADISPSGGRHIYIPLDADLPHSILAQTARTLATLHPSIDPGPHYSADTGCIRPPGSVWKRGGHQRLITPLADAIAAVTIGNPPSVLDRLIEGLEPSPAPGADDHIDVDVTAYLPPGSRQVSARIAAIARTGLYDTKRYASPSEARQAVITAAARAGVDRLDLIRRLETGIWPGLAGMYARYAHPRAALNRDWAKAQTWLSQQPGTTVQSSTTSPQVTAGATKLSLIHSDLRRLEAHLAHTEPPATSSAARQRFFLLRALIAAAHQDGSLTVARGCRSLAITSGLDRTKIPSVLTALCSEPHPLLREVRPAQGKDAAVYELLPPTSATSDRSPWSRGRPVHALRPAFRVLGLTAAVVYEALELHGQLTGRAIAARTGLSPTTVLDMLGLLHAHGLASTSHRRGNTMWTATSSQALTDAGERLGASAIVAALIVRFHTERRIWWAWLADQSLRRQAEYLSTEDLPPPLWDPGDGEIPTESHQ